MFAFMADLHIGHYSEFDVNGSRLHRCLDALRQVHQQAYDQCVAIIDCGDLLDQKNHIDFSTYNPVFQTFDDLHAPNRIDQKQPDFITLVGNHNMAKLTDPTINNLVPLQRHIQVVDTAYVETKYTAFGLLLAFIPYRRDVKQWLEDYGKISKIVAEYSGKNLVSPYRPVRKVLVAHQEIRGAVTGTHRYVASGGVDPTTLPGPFDWCIFGHYHKFQFISPKVFYCGAVLQQEFGEEGNPQGFWFYDPVNDSWQWRTIQSPHFFTVDSTPPDAYNFYRCRTTGPVPDVKQTNARFEPVPEIVTAPRLNVTDFGSLDQLIEAYLKDRVPADRHAEIKQLVNEL